MDDDSTSMEADKQADQGRSDRGAVVGEARAQAKPRRIGLWLLLAAACLVAAALIGLVSRQVQFKKLQQTTSALSD